MSGPTRKVAPAAKLCGCGSDAPDFTAIYCRRCGASFRVCPRCGKDRVWHECPNEDAP